MALIDKINNIISKYGTDKVLHFSFGGWITSILSVFGFKGVLFGLVFVAAISYYKEKYMDAVFDKNDIWAGTFGSIIAIIIYTIFVFL